MTSARSTTTGVAVGSCNSTITALAMGAFDLSWQLVASTGALVTVTCLLLLVRLGDKDNARD